MRYLSIKIHTIGFRNKDASPYRWLDMLQRNLELADILIVLFHNNISPNGTSKLLPDFLNSHYLYMTFFPGEHNRFL
jgi:hypothetical protein